MPLLLVGPGGKVKSQTNKTSSKTYIVKPGVWPATWIALSPPTSNVPSDTSSWDVTSLNQVGWRQSPEPMTWMPFRAAPSESVSIVRFLLDAREKRLWM